MRRLEHTLIGAGVGAAVAHVVGVEVVYGVMAGVAGASVPDLDLTWANRWERPRLGSCCHVWEHRGPTHSVTLAVLAGLAVGLSVAPWLGGLVAAGWLSHLLADAISPMGEPFLWPMSARRYRLMPRRFRVPSGTRLLELPIAVVVLLLGFYA